MTDYHVDAQAGDDRNDGRSAGTAWRSVARVNDADLSPGDTALFRRGQVWRERLALTRSGTAAAPITIGAYGAGANPLFSGADALTAADWQPADREIWSLDLADEPGQLFLDDRPGVRVASVSDLTDPDHWLWQDGELLLRAAAPPAQAYRAIEAALRDQGAVWNDNVDFIRYQDLRVARAKVVGLRVSGSQGIAIIGVEAFENGEDGIRLTDGATRCLIRGGSSHHNGAATDAPSGHGYILVRGASHVTVEDVEAFANAQDGLQMGESCGSHNIVQRVSSHDNGYSGLNVKSGEGHVIRFAASIGNGRYGLMSQLNLVDLEVSDSRFDDNSRSGNYANLKIENDVSLTSRRNFWGPTNGTGALAHSDGSGARASFEGDVFCGDAESRLFTVFWAEAGTGFAFRHCTFVEQQGNGLLWFEEGVGAVTLANCVLSHASGRMVRYHRATDVAIDHNLYHRPEPAATLFQIDGADDGADNGRLAAAQLADGTVQDRFGTDAGSLFGDPQFVDAAAGDYALAPGSPAIGAGDPSAAILADHRRAPVNSRRPDLGAFAFLEGAADALGGALCAPAEQQEAAVYDAGARSVEELRRLTSS